MSAERALLFDIGNTRVKWGVLDAGEIKRSGSIAHDRLRESGFETLLRRLPRRVDAALACNVAGIEFGKRFGRAVGIHIGGDLRYVRSERSAYGLTSAYREPRTLGVDRWVAMLGARAEFRTALCVVDAGTAVTIDAIDRSGQHLGGQIIPGIRLMGDALRSETSDIRAARRKPRDPAPDALPFAASTDGAVNVGAVTAVCGAIERSVKSLKSGGFRPTVVLTGGDASRILTLLQGKVFHRPNLVLQGLGFMLGNGS